MRTVYVGSVRSSPGDGRIRLPWTLSGAAELYVGAVASHWCELTTDAHRPTLAGPCKVDDRGRFALRPAGVRARFSLVAGMRLLVLAVVTPEANDVLLVAAADALAAIRQLRPRAFAAPGWTSPWTDPILPEDIEGDLS